MKHAGTGDRQAIPSDVAEMLLDLMVDQSKDAVERPNYHDVQAKFIQAVLRDPTMSEADILRGGYVFGIDFTRPRAVILVDARSYILRGEVARDAEVAAEQIQQRSKTVIESIVRFFDLPRDTICAYIGNGEVAILKASTTQDLAGWVEHQDNSDWGTTSWANLTALKRAATGLLASIRRDTGAEITIGIGRYHPGIHGLCRSYQDAGTALSLGVQVEGENQVYCLDRLGIAAFVGVADERTKIDLAAHLLSPLDHAPELLDTLEVFFHENCCPSSTASRLSIHRNTLRYRLDKIASLTGLDPRLFDDAVQIRLALVLRVLQQNSA